MEKSKAFRIFGISHDFSVEELNRNFRQLVKKYHPDKNPQDPEWAHDQMIIINDAYSLLLKYLSTAAVKEDLPPEVEKADVELKDVEFDDFFNREFHISTEYFLSSLWIFFLYGLENPHLRKEGTRRFRYRECFNLMEKSLIILIPLKEYNLSPEERKIFDTFYHFVIFFFDNLKKRWRPLPDIKINLAFQKNIKSLFLYIKRSLVPDLLETRQMKIKNEDIILTLSSLYSLKSKTNNPQILNEVDNAIKFANIFFDLIEFKERGILNLEI